MRPLENAASSSSSLVYSPINLARVMMVLGLRSEIRSSGTRLLKRLDLSSARAFEKDVRSLIAPWMWWLSLPLAITGLVVTFVLNAMNSPDSLNSTIGWMFILDSPLVAIAVFCYLATLKIRRVDPRRELTEDRFSRTLLILSLLAHCTGALTGLVGSFLIPSFFVPWP